MGGNPERPHRHPKCQTAAETKWAGINELDKHLTAFEKNATARGTQVHWTCTSEQARQVIVEIIQRHKAQHIMKSKVTTSEEIHLSQLLESLGFDVVESDLFENHLGTAQTHDPEELTMIARIRDALTVAAPKPGSHDFDLKTDVIIAADAEAAHTQLRAIAAAVCWKTVATHGSGIASQATESRNLPTLSTDGGYDVNELETCDVGISECDALIAQTGSALLTSRSGGGRSLSVLPPHHVVIARMDQLVPDLPAACELLHHSYDKAG